jgi:hypothetical protein
MNELYWAGIRYLPDCAYKYFREVKRDSIMSCVVQVCVLECLMLFIAAYHRLFSTGDQQYNISALSIPHGEL